MCSSQLPASRTRFRAPPLTRCSSPPPAVPPTETLSRAPPYSRSLSQLPPSNSSHHAPRAGAPRGTSSLIPSRCSPACSCPSSSFCFCSHLQPPPSLPSYSCAACLLTANSTTAASIRLTGDLPLRAISSSTAYPPFLCATVSFLTGSLLSRAAQLELKLRPLRATRCDLRGHRVLKHALTVRLERVVSRSVPRNPTQYFAATFRACSCVTTLHARSLPLGASPAPFRPPPLPPAPPRPSPTPSPAPPAQEAPAMRSVAPRRAVGARLSFGAVSLVLRPPGASPALFRPPPLPPRSPPALPAQAAPTVRSVEPRRRREQFLASVFSVCPSSRLKLSRGSPQYHKLRSRSAGGVGRRGGGKGGAECGSGGAGREVCDGRERSGGGGDVRVGRWCFAVVSRPCGAPPRPAMPAPAGLDP